MCRNKIILLFAVISFCSLQLVSQNTSATDVLKAMHAKYYKAPCKCYTFSQRNKHYRNDSVIKTSEWHEAVEFPDKFMIIFGEKSLGNKVLFRNDSMYRYKKSELLKAERDSNSLLLFLGGMYYRELSEAIERMKKAGYNLDRFSEQSWNGKPVYVLGAKENDLAGNQLWVDKKTLRVLRIIEKLGPSDQMDMRFESHQDMCKGYTETKVSFRRNGKLEQEEEYYDIKAAEKFPW